MTSHSNDPDQIMRERNRRVSQVNYSPWLIGGALAVVVALAIFFMSGNHFNTTASTVQHPVATAPATPPPATTGSGAPTAPAAR